jgi:hypothetical protein
MIEIIWLTVHLLQDTLVKNSINLRKNRMKCGLKVQNNIAAKTEYKWNFYKHWGAVAFTGTGSVWGNDAEDDGEEAFQRDGLPSAGTGLRFMFSPEKRLTYVLIMHGEWMVTRDFTLE